jgi:hypothetical protein
MGKQKKKVQEQVFGLYDHHDVRDMQEAIEDLAARGGAHVYAVPNLGNTFVVSAVPLAPRSVQRAYLQCELEMAREDLKAGEAPGDVWQTHCVSAVNISRIAKQEGISLPRHWFKHAWEAANPGKSL